MTLSAGRKFLNLDERPNRFFLHARFEAAHRVPNRATTPANRSRLPSSRALVYSGSHPLRRIGTTFRRVSGLAAGLMLHPKLVANFSNSSDAPDDVFGPDFRPASVHAPRERHFPVFHTDCNVIGLDLIVGT